jgi:hypothetical protein
MTIRKMDAERGKLPAWVMDELINAVGCVDADVVRRLFGTNNLRVFVCFEEEVGRSELLALGAWGIANSLPTAMTWALDTQNAASCAAEDDIQLTLRRDLCDWAKNVVVTARSAGQ